jgi:hypothetical protein
LFEDDDPPPLTLTDDVLTRLQDDHPEVRLMAASFLQRHLEPGMTGAAARIERALQRGEIPLSLLLLEALKRHDTKEAHAVLLAQTHNDGPVSARARELLDGFAPTHGEWLFVPRMDTTPPGPALTGAQRPPAPSASAPNPRPSRVRAVTGTPASSADVVEPKDG